MKVKELIKELQELNPDYEVKFEENASNSYTVAQGDGMALVNIHTSVLEDTIVKLNSMPQIIKLLTFLNLAELEALSSHIFRMRENLKDIEKTKISELLKATA